MPKKVLIFDDEPVTTRALALDLRDAGYRVDTARDGDEAVRKLRGSSFDLLIASERSIGEGSGEVLAWWWRVRPAAKVVLMTTEDARDRRVEMSERGAKVHKPFDLEEFRSVVQRLLEPETKVTGRAS
jgi:DNA-binding response OmpR family regulator